MLSIADLVTLSVLQAITPSLREAVSAIARGDRKGGINSAFTCHEGVQF